MVQKLEAPHCPGGGMSAEISCSLLATAQPAFGALSEVLGFGLFFESNKNDIAHGVQLCVLWMLGCMLEDVLHDSLMYRFI